MAHSVDMNSVRMQYNWIFVRLNDDRRKMMSRMRHYPGEEEEDPRVR